MRITTNSNDIIFSFGEGWKILLRKENGLPFCDLQFLLVTLIQLLTVTESQGDPEAKSGADLEGDQGQG